MNRIRTLDTEDKTLASGKEKRTKISPAQLPEKRHQNFRHPGAETEKRRFDD